MFCSDKLMILFLTGGALFSWGGTIHASQRHYYIYKLSYNFFSSTLWTLKERLDGVSEICEPSIETLDNINFSNSVSIDFFTSLNSIPNEKGFKMAFLNIVSLPKIIDEIRYSMSKKYIDLIAFNETRLDSNITDNIVHLTDYDIIRKDRSRNGGGVCIYLRSSINYKIRNDLVPSELEAVCIEIIKPHSISCYYSL